MRFCLDCRAGPLPIHRNGKSPYRCGPCRYKKYRESTIATTTRWKKNPANREKVLRHRKQNDEWRKRSGYARRYYELNKQRIFARNKKWREANKAHSIIINRVSQIRRRSSTPISPLEVLQKFIALGYQCQLCMKLCSLEQLDIDHIVPLDRGGPNTIDNIQPLCRACNNKKANLIVGVDISVAAFTGVGDNRNV